MKETVVERSSGLLSELVLVRMHGRTAEYLAASGERRDAIVRACRVEASVRDLPERILARTVYSQAATRSAQLRELVQNALDASPRGARIDVRSSRGDREVIVSDRGRGMSRAELLEDLLVPFRSGKLDEVDAIGEHGIGFLSALEISPSLEITTLTRGEGFRLAIRPVGSGPPYADFAWSFTRLEASSLAASGTAVRLELTKPIDPSTLVAEVSHAASLVDTSIARIYVNDTLVNTVRSRMRRVARATIGEGAALGELELYAGRGDGVAPHLSIAQRGLLVTVRQEPFAGPERSLHRDLFRALSSAGYGLVAELPTRVPLNKGRSAVAAYAARAVESALTLAFERFVLEDALYDRELLRSVDHRLASVLDRLVGAALAGEPAAPPALTGVDELAPTARSGPPGAPLPERAPERAPTVAAPEDVVRFATTLVDTALFTALALDDDGRERARTLSLRQVLAAHRSGVLRASGESLAGGLVYLTLADPLAQSLWRRLASMGIVTVAPRAQVTGTSAMSRVGRERLDAEARSLPGAATVSAALALLERIDAAVSQASGVAPTAICVHQDLYGPDEMAHTDGTGISVNLASPRIRTLLGAVLGCEDVIAFAALVDLITHEKAHVALASFVARATAEHGASFYRRKDALRRRLLEGVRSGQVADPIRWLPSIRRGLSSALLPAPELLAAAFAAPPLAA